MFSCERELLIPLYHPCDWFGYFLHNMCDLLMCLQQWHPWIIINSKRFSCEKRASTSTELPVRPIDAADTALPMRLIQLCMRRPCHLFDASHVWPHVRPILAAAMPHARPIDTATVILEKAAQWVEHKKNVDNFVMHSNIKMRMLKKA